MPARIPRPPTRNLRRLRPGLEFLQVAQGLIQIRSGADDADLLPHHLLKGVLYVEGVVARRLPVEGGQRFPSRGFDVGAGHLGQPLLLHKIGGVLTRPLPKYHQVREGIPAKTVRPVEPRRAFPPRQRARLPWTSGSQSRPAPPPWHSGW